MNDTLKKSDADFLILIVHNQQNDYIYDMNTYNALAFMSEKKKKFSFLTLSTRLHSYEEILLKAKEYKRVALLFLAEVYNICKVLVSDICKESNASVYAYGALVSVAPEEVICDVKGLTGVIVGDAEEELYLLCDCDEMFAGQKTKSKIKFGKLFELGKLKYSSASLVEYGKIQNHIRINTTSGCLHECNFCILNKKYGFDKSKKYEIRTMEAVFDEIVYIYEKYGITSFYFNDRNITDGGKERIKKLCDYLEEYGGKFTFCAFARADSFEVGDIQLLEKMRKNGFLMLDIGIEAGNNDDLNLYNKQTTKEQNFEIIRLLRKVDIDIRVNFIMLNPFSTFKTIYENYIFLSENNVHLWHCYISRLKLYCGTPLHKKTLNYGLLGTEYYPGDIYGYMCYDYFADEYRKYIEWIENEKEDILYKTLKNEKVLEDILRIFCFNEMAKKKYMDSIKKIKRELADINSKYFSFILEKRINKGYLEFEHFQRELEYVFLKINILWNKVKRV